MSPRKRLLVRLSGSAWMQRFYQRQAQLFLFAMGVGAGEAVEGSGEKAVFQLIRKYLGGPYTVLDAGANVGQFLGQCLEQLGNNLEAVHSFEPIANTFAKLQQKFDGQPRIHLNHSALAAQCGAQTAWYGEHAEGLASLSKRDISHFGIAVDQSETVQVNTVDNYCESHAINHVHFLKIDVEGHELDVLAGAKAMLKRKAIDLITFEFGGCHIDTRTYFKDFWLFLSGHGYQIHRITPSGYMMKIERYEEFHEQFVTTNFLAVREGLIIQ